MPVKLICNDNRRARWMKVREELFSLIEGNAKKAELIVVETPDTLIVETDDTISGWTGIKLEIDDLDDFSVDGDEFALVMYKVAAAYIRQLEKQVLKSQGLTENI